MKKSRSILAFSLALNAALSAYSGSAPAKIQNMNADNLYSKITRDLKSGKSSSATNKLLESILKKRNKELNDLYAQSNYIVKPEYLEWQIFATGFYAERDRGDNSSENGKYLSDVQGYYDSDGNYIVTSGKPYREEQEVKEVNLGLSIPIRGISVGEISLSPSGVSIPANFEVSANVTVPAVPSVANLTLSSFTPTAPSVSAPTVFTPPSLSKVASGFGQGAPVGVNVQETVMIGNASVEANASGTTITTLNQGWNSNNSFTWSGNNDRKQYSGT